MPRRAAADHVVRPIVSALPKRLKPPETLSEGARAEFGRVVTAEKADHFRRSDLSMLCQYCESAALAEVAIKEARRESPPNARWLAAWREATRTMKDLALRLRLSPQSRQTHNHTRPEPRLSYYEREALGLEDGDSDDAQ
jgi:phage terminase small subunit